MKLELVLNVCKYATDRPVYEIIIEEYDNKTHYMSLFNNFLQIYKRKEKDELDELIVTYPSHIIQKVVE